MSRLNIILLVVLALGGCATYKIEPSIDHKTATHASSSGDVFVTPLTEFPEGTHCFEPMLFFLSLGIVPTHCIERFHVSDSEPPAQETKSLSTHFTVTYVQGWVALPMLLSPKWRWGYGENAPAEIKLISEKDEP